MLLLITAEINMMVCELQSDLASIEILIKEQPKDIIHKRQILLFPEYNPGQYYKLVFGKILFWMFMFLPTYYLFTLGKQYITNLRDIRQQELLMEVQNPHKSPKVKIHK